MKSLRADGRGSSAPRVRLEQYHLLHIPIGMTNYAQALDYCAAMYACIALHCSATLPVAGDLILSHLQKQLLLGLHS